MRNLRPGRERPGDRDALALAARQLVRAALGHVARSGVSRTRSSSSSTRRRTSRARAMPGLWMRSGRSRWCSIDVERVQRRERVLEHHLHVAAVRRDLRGCGCRPACRRAGSAPRSGSRAARSIFAMVDLPEPDSPDQRDVRPALEREATRRRRRAGVETLQPAAEPEVLDQVARLERARSVGGGLLGAHAAPPSSGRSRPRPASPRPAACRCARTRRARRVRLGNDPTAAAWCTRAADRGRSSVGGAELDDLALQHDGDPVADLQQQRQVVGDEDRPRSPARSRSRMISRRIPRCTTTSSAVVGSSMIMTCGSSASAIAIMTRWRMPPDSSCG